MALRALLTDKKTVVSAACIAAGLVAALDFGFGITHPLASINTVNTDKGEPYNTVVAIKKDMAATGSGANVFLLGSSLVVAPALQCEADFRGQSFKRFHDRRLTSFETYLEGALRLQSGAKVPAPRSYLLAVGGEMASDAYILTKEILAKEILDRNTNTCIIYGIAPRDFHDNLFPRVDSSPVFRIFGKLEDLPGLFAAEPTLSADEQKSACVERLSSFYRYRSDWQKLFDIRAKRLIEKCLPFVVFEKYSESLALKQQKKGLLPGEAIGTPLVVPQTALDHESVAATHDEYKRRYNPLKPAKYQAQFAYFERLLAYCQEHNASLLVVNMPLSQDNMALLPKDSYKNYLSGSTQLCEKYGVEFVDLNNSAWNQESNFVDSVHLAPKASQAFMRKLATLAAKSNMAVASRRGKKEI